MRNRIAGRFLIEALITCCGLFQQPVKLLGRKIVVEEINRIDLVAVFVYFIMAVRAGALAGAAYPADHFATLYLSGLHVLLLLTM